MTSTRRLIWSAASVGVVASLFALRPSGDVRAQGPAAAGRFAAILPHESATSPTGSVLWVLDTQTGEVQAHRIISVTGTDNRLVGTFRQRLTEAPAVPHPGAR